MDILKVEDLTKIYGKDETQVTALDQVTFSVKKGEFVAIVGPSGSGKSTLLHILGGVDRPTRGKVFIEETDVYSLNETQLAIFRRRQIGLRMYAALNEGADRQQFEAQVQSIDARLHPDKDLMIADIDQTLNEAKNTKTMISIFLYGFVALITLIGVTNIFNTISTNVALRRREFAMLKSVGLTPAGFNKMINYESIFYGLKALLYGLPLGILVNVLIYRSANNVFEFAFAIPWKEVIICIVGVLVIVFITMLHASSRLKKENIGDALREENL